LRKKLARSTIRGERGQLFEHGQGFRWDAGRQAPLEQSGLRTLLAMLALLERCDLHHLRRLARQTCDSDTHCDV